MPQRGRAEKGIWDLLTLIEVLYWAIKHWKWTLVLAMLVGGIVLASKGWEPIGAAFTVLSLIAACAILITDSNRSQADPESSPPKDRRIKKKA
jgi:hypothetical protein